MNEKKEFTLAISPKDIEAYLKKVDVTQKQFFLGCFCLVQFVAYERRYSVIGTASSELFIEVNPAEKTADILKKIMPGGVKEGKKAQIVDFYFNESQDNLSNNRRPNLDIMVAELNNEYSITYDFSPLTYSEETITVLSLHYATLIQDLINNPQQLVRKTEVISKFEKTVIDQSNETDRPYSNELCIHERITKTAEEHPNEIALQYGELEVTYADLEKKANKLARHLLVSGVGKGDIVGIMVPRGIELIVSIIAVLKSGAAYMALSSSIPLPRIDFMLKNSQSKAIITMADIELDSEINVVNLLSVKLELISSAPLSSQTTPDSVAALIYTSGTTGTPKGVLIRHDTVVNYCEYNLDEIVIPVGTNVVQFAPFMFSTMIYEVITTLFSGARLHLVDDNIITDIKQFQMYIMTHPINFLLLPSQYANYLTIPDTITAIETGASDCRPEVSAKIGQTADHFHAYGLTEGSIVAVWKRPKEAGTIKKIPIGKPVYNTKAYVLDSAGNPQGMYMPGELCVTGLAVSSGYLNMPELTAQRFVENPFGTGKMLRTGDIVQWNYHGEIEYVGRRDNQVKIRDMRVELEEVEHHLALNDNVVSAAVIAKEDEHGDHFLVAFITNPEKVNLPKLRETLNQQMLDYMIPSFIIQIAQLPMSANGKIDKNVLAEVKLERQVPYVRPTTRTEEQLVHIFQETLGTEQTGIKDNFFDEGGHSLRASKLLNLIEKNMGVRLSFADIFSLLTPEKIGEAIDKKVASSYQSIPNVAATSQYPMSSAQRRLYFVSQMDVGENAYHLPYVVAIKGQLDHAKMRGVFQELLNRHETLRTSFEIVDNEPMQLVKESIEATIGYQQRLDFTIDTDVVELMKFIQPFDLRKAPLIRFDIIEVAEGNSLLLVDMHHIISDALSLNILMAEVSALYNGVVLTPPKIDYKDYSAWMAQLDLTKEASYWQEEFKEMPPALNLPLDYPRPVNQSFQAGFLKEVIDSDLKAAILALAKETGTTEYMVLLSAFMIILSKYSLQEEIVVGSPISGRIHRDTENMFGFFVNSLAMKGQPSQDKRYLDFLESVKETCLNAYENQAYSFETLVETLDVPRDLSRHPLFDVMLVVQNNEKVKLELNGLDAVVKIPEETTAQYDLTFTITDQADGYALDINYDSALFKRETMRFLQEHFKFVLQQITQNATLLIKEISTVTPAEKQLIETTFNETTTPYNKQTTVVDLFENQVAQEPEKEIIVFEKELVTYHELNQRANQVAHKLRQAGVKPNDFVALYMGRSLEMFISLLGVLKAGAAYVPLNVNYPQKRIDLMLTDLKPAVILTYKASLTDVSDSLVIELENFDFSGLPKTNPSHVNQPSDAIYGIYTSGTTGKPKAVVIEHRNIVNYCQTHTVMRQAITTPNPSIVSVTEYSFDIFVTEYLFSLTNSVKVILANEEQASDPVAFAELMLSTQGELLQTTPAKLKQLTSHPKAAASLGSLTTIIVGGEELPNDLLAYVRRMSSAKLMNAYGPTETTIISSMTEVTEGHYTIGQPLDNYQIYVQSNGLLNGIGVPGELVIAGAGVGRGYLGQPQLTAEKFITNPYGDGQLYLTGDLGRWLPNGELDYLGRMDSQVKVRGFRIELEEIATVIRKQKGVNDAAVIIREDSQGQPAINAYVVADYTLTFEWLKDQLRKELPEHMIPMYLLQLERLPLNASGKLATKELPLISLVETQAIIQPRNATEQTVADIFKKVLGIDTVSATSNFFELGGHSLRLTSTVNHLEQAFGQRLSLQALFANPTVEAIAKLIPVADSITDTEIPQVAQQPYYPMSSAQQRLYIMDQLDDVGLAYNMPALLKFEGEMDRDRLQTAINHLLARHDILRTSFEMVAGQPMQCINDAVSLPIAEVPVNISNTELLETDLLNYFVRPFDLAQAPLMRIAVTPVVNGTTYLLVDVHHIISDGLSVNLLLNEFNALYHSLSAELPALTIQYKDYSEWLRQRDLSSQKQYWQLELAKKIPALNLPLDYPRPLYQDFKGQTIRRVLHQDLKEQIVSLAQATSATPYMVVLSAFMMLLSKQSLQEKLAIGTPTSGRLHQQTEGLIGMFVNTLLLSGDVQPGKPYLEFLEEVKLQSIRAVENQEFPFEELVELADVPHDLGRNPLFDVMFVYQDDTSIDQQLRRLNVSEMSTIDSIAKFDLSVTLAEKEIGYELSFNYATSLFKGAHIEYLMDHFEALLTEITAMPSKNIADYSGVTEAEQAIILQDFNQPSQANLSVANCDELFQKNVQLFSDKAAVVFGSKSVSYDQLNGKAKQLAEQLVKRGLAKGQFVALECTRSIDMVIAILAVIKAGGVYVPIDPDYPEERVRYLLEEVQPRFVLTNRLNATTSKMGETLVIKELMSEHSPATTIHLPVLTKNDLVYALYTSGTTGKPKGVLIKQEGILNLQTYFRETLDVSADDHVLQFASYSFDASVWEMSMALLNGGTLHLVESEVINDIEQLSRYVQKSITVATLPPQYAAQLPISDLKLRLLVTAGSSAIKGVVYQTRGQTRYVNAYGPSETTVCATSWEDDGQARIIGSVPIGKPIINSQSYVMIDQQLVGVGAPGELCVAGDNLSQGYYHLPEMTQRHFVANPFGPGKLYRTGDIVRFLADGNLEYLGRMDRQVKVRGYRIELSEVEETLRQIPVVVDAAVVARKDTADDYVLQGFVVMKTGTPFDSEQLKQKLGERLPRFMVPTNLQELATIPMTVNGKLDETALPELVNATTSPYLAPTTEVEMALVAIFTDVLTVANLGVLADFFELGGDSIKAIRIVSKLREAGYETTVKDILQWRTIQSIASKVSLLSDLRDYEQGEVVGTIPLTPIQTYFFANDYQVPAHFNQALLLESQQVIESSKLQVVLKELLSHHDALRSVFVGEAQTVLSSQDSHLFYFETVDCHLFSRDDEALKEQILTTNSRVQTEMNLTEGPLVRVVLYKTKEKDYLFLCIHHLVVDAVSWRIILDDLALAYEQLANGQVIKLPAKTASFKDWSLAVENYQSSQALAQEVSYWQNEVANSQGLAIKTSYPAVANNWTPVYQAQEFKLSPSQTANLQYQANQAYNTEINDLLISALGWSLKEWRQQSAFSVQVEGHGREQLNTAMTIDRTVGWFTSIYPVTIPVASDLAAAIIGVKETVRKIPNHGVGYGMIKYGSAYNMPSYEPSISFNYLGQVDERTSTNAVFALSSLPLGDTIAASNDLGAPILVTIKIEQEQLVVQIDYDTGLFSETEMSSFVAGYQKALVDVIEHCTSQKETTRTLSDLGVADIEDEDLAMLNELLNEL